MLLIGSRLGLLGAVCCLVSASPVRIGCFLPLLAALVLASVLPFHVVFEIKGEKVQTKLEPDPRNYGHARVYRFVRVSELNILHPDAVELSMKVEIIPLLTVAKFMHAVQAWP